MILSSWKQQYENEQTRLLDALGRVTEGGIVEAIQHISATSVPGLGGSPCVDIGLAVWPFPVEDGPTSKLAALGYHILNGYPGSREQRFRHDSRSFQLFIVEPGSEQWSNLILVSDYLCHSEKAREEVSTSKKDASIDKAALFNGLLPDAYQWWTAHYGFPRWNLSWMNCRVHRPSGTFPVAGPSIFF